MATVEGRDSTVTRGRRAPRLRPRRRGRYDFPTIMTLLVVAMLVPTTVFFVFSATSMGAGVGVAAVFFLGLATLGVVRGPSANQMLNWLAAVTLILVFLFSHGLLASLFQRPDFTREWTSLALFGLLLIGAFSLSFAIFQLDEKATTTAISVLLALFIAIGVAGIANIQPTGIIDAFRVHTAYKPVFPFTEPSHYAITFTPILLSFCATRGVLWRVAAITAAFVIAYLLQSLTLVLGGVVVALICLPLRWFVVAAAALAVGAKVLSIDYFTQRLDFTGSNDNISVLVYLQGWDLATEALKRSHFWGIGFQQIGLGEITSLNTDTLVRLTGQEVNLKDGGFTLAKIVSETGVFGIALMVAYSVALVRSAWRLRRIALRRSRATAGIVLALSLVCSYMVESFGRGMGYFSGSTMLLIAALLFLHRYKLLK